MSDHRLNSPSYAAMLAGLMLLIAIGAVYEWMTK